MKSIWINAILPVLIVAQFVACAKKNEDRAPVATSRASKPQQTPQKVETTKGLPSGNEAQRKPVEQIEPRSANSNLGEKPSGAAGAPAQAKPLVVTHLASRYTSAGDDYLRDYLNQKMDSVQDTQARLQNQAAAERIQTVRTNIDRETGDVAVTLKEDAAKGSREVILGGTLDEKGVAQIASGSNKSIKGTLICLDRDETTCFSAYVRLVTEIGGKKAVVNIISRKTAANFDFKIPTTASGNREFTRLVELFSNTEKKNGELNSLRNILVESFEVIKGRSGVKLSMISNEDEVIVASGPLLASADGGTLTNVLMKRAPFFDDLVDLEKGRTFKTGFSKTLSEIRMIENDAKKNITLSMTVRPAANSAEESLIVTFVRQTQAIMSLSELEELFAAVIQNSKN